MSKLSDYLTTNKIDPRRIALASKGVERHTREDLVLIAKKAAIKAGTAEKNPEISKAKPRSGRPVTVPQLERAMRGEAVPGPAKTRIVKAINVILTGRKKPEAGFRDLF